MIDDCTALILAGGASRRMGQDKAALMLQGKTLLKHVTETMQHVFPKVIVCARALRSDVTLPQVCDERAGNGPLAGLVAGLAQVDTPWMFAVACDMPFISPALVRSLAGLRTQGDAVVPVVDGYLQPLAAFYAKSALPIMRQCLMSGEHSLRGVLRGLNVCYVSEAQLREFDPQLRSFFDLDTPQDVRAATFPLPVGEG